MCVTTVLQPCVTGLGINSMAKPKASKLTKARVNEIQPTDKPTDYADSSLVGFLLRCHPTGKKVYYFRYRFHGGTKFLSLGTTSELSVAEARDLAQEAAVSVRKDICPATQRKEAIRERERLKLKTFGRYVEGPYTENALRRSSGRGQESINMVKKQYRSWMNTPLAEITPAMVIKWRTDRRDDGIKQNTIRRYETELRSLFNSALEDGTISTNPLHALPIERASEGRIRYLIPEEEQRLRSALIQRDREGTEGRTKSIHGWSFPADLSTPYTDHLTPAILLSLNTGMRAGELRTLQWSDIAHDLSMVSLQAAKTKSKNCLLYTSPSPRD